jgi:hypothetical protein
MPVSPFLYLLSLGLGIAINVLFCLTLIKTLSYIRESNRTISPALVWLLLIPGFNTLWNFFVVARLSQSIRKELESRDFEVSGSPTLIIGLIYSFLSALVLFISPDMLKEQSIGLGIFGLAVIIAFVQYWTKVNWYKKVFQKDSEANYPDEQV